MDGASGAHFLHFSHFLAEWYLPELDNQAVEAVVAKLKAAATAVSAEGTPVELVVTLAVPTDEVLYGVFDAEDSDVVSRTCLQAGVPHQRLSNRVGTWITPATQISAGSNLRSFTPR